MKHYSDDTRELPPGLEAHLMTGLHERAAFAGLLDAIDWQQRTRLESLYHPTWTPRERAAWLIAEARRDLDRLIADGEKPRPVESYADLEERVELLIRSRLVRVRRVLSWA